MNHLDTNGPICKLMKKIDPLVSFIAFAAIVGVVFFAGWQIAEMFQHIFAQDTKGVFHSIALVILLIKAYKLLFFYMESHHVSIRYVLEIAIIAPTIELVFAPGNASLELNILYAVFGIASAIVYLKFYQELHSADRESIHEDELLED